MRPIIIRVLTQMKNDKRSLILLLGAPVLVLTLLYFILGNSDYTPTIAVYNIPDAVISMMDDADIEVLNEMPDCEQYLEDNSADAVFYADKEGMHIYMFENNTISGKVVKIISKTADQSKVTKDYVYETSSDNTLDSYSFVFLGVLSFFFVFILSGMAFVRERFEQTLERMLMAPVKRSQIIAGYGIGYGILAALQAVIIIMYSIFILKLSIEGCIFTAILIMILMAFVAVLVGALLSIFANNELQLVQFIPVVIVPQIFFSGLIPLETIPFHLGSLCYLTPVYYACIGLKQVLIYGKDFWDVIPYTGGLLIYIVVLFFLNTFSLKKYRKI